MANFFETEHLVHVSFILNTNIFVRFNSEIGILFLLNRDEFRFNGFASKTPE
jgi:hypothetical protein